MLDCIRSKRRTRWKSILGDIARMMDYYNRIAVVK